ncbi:MSC_0623 family F1-like ATPase-associated protein [Metamycoplasma gateae]|uniref:DUF2714 domain-containing protein n=1 Tax=Metamycoplasma gateae TaxID=35769 RepID=A0ABZ2ANA2_9BACT|nr:DUF2714 domain-containing protein [Metamycoplasma gateae]
MKIDKKKLLLQKEALAKVELINEKFDEILRNKNVISNDKLMSTILLKSTKSFKSKEVTKLLNLIKQATTNKFDLIFDELIISYKLDQSLNNLFLVPYISNEISTNFESINLKSNNSNDKDNLIQIFNKEIKELLEQDYYVEILDNIIIKKDLSNNIVEIFYNSKNIVGW